MDITEDIQALTTFCNNSAEFLRRLKKTKRPMVFTINGNAVAVMQDAAAYQRLLDIVAQADVQEGIRQGRDDVGTVRTHNVRAALKAVRRLTC